MRNSKIEKEPKLSNKNTRKPELKNKGNKLRHEHKKRRKEGEERVHEDGGMVG